jgi:hypothetical protein
LKLSGDNENKESPCKYLLTASERGLIDNKNKQKETKLFFANFDRDCSVKYTAAAQYPPNHKRKLESELKIIFLSKPASPEKQK